MQISLLPRIPANQALTFGQLPALLRVKKARLGMLATFLVFGGQFVGYTYITPFLTQDAGLGAKAISALLLIYGGMMPISVQTWMFRAAPDAMESGSAVFVATTQVSVACGALVGGVLVDHMGVASAMVVGGLFAVAMAIAIAVWGKDSGKPTVRLHAVP